MWTAKPAGSSLPFELAPLDLLPERFQRVEVMARALPGGEPLDRAKAALEFAGRLPQCCLRVDVEFARQIGCGKQDVAEFVFDPRPIRGPVRPVIEFGFKLLDLLTELVDDGPRRGPIETDAGGAALYLGGAGEGGQRKRDPVEHAWRPPHRRSLCCPLFALVLLPGFGLRRGGLDLGIAEDMRMAAHHLVGNRRRDMFKIEEAFFLGHARVKHDLKQQVAEFVLQRRHIPARNRVGDLISLFERIGRNCRKILLQIPRATALGRAQPSHDRKQAVEGTGHRQSSRFGQPTPHRAAQARTERR